MKITLKNFRCHTDRVFEIPETGLVNLSGASGDGKSTVLSSIVYGFYGKIPGKSKKPYSLGKKSCTVEIEYLGLTIARTKPNRVTVVQDGVSTEDDAAQSIIVEAVGMSYEEFMVGAYIVQRSNASILSMTPLEQVRFIEVLAATSAEQVKEVIKVKKEGVKENSLKIQGELDSLLGTLEELQGELPEEPPPIPDEILEGFVPADARKKIKRLEGKASTLSAKSEEVQLKISEIRKEEKLLENTRRKIRELETKLGMCQISIEGATSVVEGLEPIKSLQQSVVIYEERLKSIKKREELQKRRIDFEKAVKEHISSTSKAIKKLEDGGYLRTLEELGKFEMDITDVARLEAEYSAAKVLYDQCEKAKADAKRRLSSILKEIKNLMGGDIPPPTQPLKLIKFLKKIKASMLTFECPSCQARVYLDGSTPCLVEDPDSPTQVKVFSVSTIDDYISKIGDISKALKADVSSPPDPPSVSSSTMQKEYMKMKRVRDEYDSLSKEGSLPPVLERMKKSILDEEKKLGVKDIPPTPLEDVDSLEEMLSTAKQKVAEVKRLRAEIKVRNEESKKYDREIAKLEASLPTERRESLTLNEAELSKITKEVVDLNLQISKERAKLDGVAEYEGYLAALEAVKKCKGKIKTSQHNLKDANELLEGLIGLEATCKEAEILALEETVSSINEHAKVYLDYFFEDPIIVELRCVKEVKSKKVLKLQMNTSIEYRGDTYGDIEELSGGERQRCDIAFLLAVSDILGGKMLLLDECLNNLDASINTEVLGLVRDLCGSEKLVLVISHEAVKGLFDHSIDVARR